MDLKLFKQHLANTQKKTISEAEAPKAGDRYATKYPGFTVTIPPDKEGTIELAGGQTIHLKKGDVVDITTTNGHTYQGVTLVSVVDIKHEYPSGKIIYTEPGNSSWNGTSGGLLTSIKKH